MSLAPSPQFEAQLSAIEAYLPPWIVCSHSRDERTETVRTIYLLNLESMLDEYAPSNVAGFLKSNIRRTAATPEAAQSELRRLYGIGHLGCLNLHPDIPAPSNRVVCEVLDITPSTGQMQIVEPPDDYFAYARERFPDLGPAYPADWEIPTREYIQELALKYRCRFPVSFIEFQTCEAARTPMADRDFDGFGWANPELQRHFSLEDKLAAARQIDLPDCLVAFRDDNGDFHCFDTRDSDGNDAEFPVVLWDHNGNEISDSASCFGDWLVTGLENPDGRR
jgi:hypothetical protein